MPIVTIPVIENVSSDEQRDAMIEKATEAMVEVEGEAMRDETWVLYEWVPYEWVPYEEVRDGSWAIGGKVPQLPKP
jgi:4-oxalocrotonate tautomerase